MLKKLNSHLFSIVCANCGVRQSVSRYGSGRGRTVQLRMIAQNELVQAGWSYLTAQRSFCPACSMKVARGEIPE